MQPVLRILERERDDPSLRRSVMVFLGTLGDPTA